MLFDIIVYGHVALFIAIPWGHQAIFQLLTREGQIHTCRIYTLRDVTIWHAVQYRKFDMLKLLVTERVRPDHCDLHLATYKEISVAVAILENSHMTMSQEKMRHENWIQDWEDKRSGDPDFQWLVWQAESDRQ